jgi:uncharacterized protein YkwD
MINKYSWLLLFFSFFSLVTAQQTMNEKLLLELINEIRSEGCFCGNQELKPVNEVIWNKNLAEVAYNHSHDLYTYTSKNEQKFVYLSHVGTDGSTLDNRLERANITTKNILENIGYVQGNERIIVDYWINNPETCKNLMHPGIASIGIGRSGNFWTMLLTSAFITK